MIDFRRLYPENIACLPLLEAVRSGRMMAVMLMTDAQTLWLLIRLQEARIRPEGFRLRLLLI